MKERSIKWMLELVEMETLTDYTCDADYVSEWNELMGSQNAFVHGVLTDENKPSIIAIEGIGEVEVGLNKMPKSLSSVAEAMTAFMQIIGLAKESLRKILLRGEFEEYNALHC
ncbi:dynamin-related protein 4C-like [Pyrus ussuriensis x Pyrus communis]|uniref:Dynamin-related protein 4C-like n=1 Tax=Pyrus ussuriensis x Pyrus communis TaxID=2448454 RepID=A0A5N5FX29_9ROSA|nr:dynamin-related protein 4C-like [Pyrus ussuriensis x Pyrus communis]